MDNTDIERKTSETTEAIYEPPALTAIGTIEELTLVEDIGQETEREYGSKNW